MQYHATSTGKTVHLAFTLLRKKHAISLKKRLRLIDLLRSPPHVLFRWSCGLICTRFYVQLMSSFELSYVIFEETFLTETEKNILGKVRRSD